MKTRRSVVVSFLLGLLLVPATTITAGSEDNWFERKTTWHGYDQFHFRVDGRPCYIVKPKERASGNPWIWRARFPDYHSEMDVALVGKGFHIAYLDAAGMFGSPKAIAHWEKFYEYLTSKHGLAAKPALEGVSRGGLFIYNWAAKHPDKVACIYADTPVCDFKSWPAGKGTGLGSPQSWAECLKAYGLTEEQALQYKKNPVDNLDAIAKARIPILHIVSENDRVVPPKENTYLLKARLEELGHTLEVISVPEGTAESNGHHFAHPCPDRVVEFIQRHATVPDRNGM